MTCVVSKTYEAWSTPTKYPKAVLVPDGASTSSPEAGGTALETSEAGPDTEKK